MIMSYQVGIIDTYDYEYDLTIETNMQSSNNSMCMDIEDEMMCNMSDGCEWMMGMCMESSDSCMDIEDQMMCNMSDGCEWMRGKWMET